VVCRETRRPLALRKSPHGGVGIAGPSTTILRSSGRDDNSVGGFEYFPLDLLRPNRIVIPTGAPKDRSGRTCGFSPHTY
jgi:hypothetical protein